MSESKARNPLGLPNGYGIKVTPQSLPYALRELEQLNIHLANTKRSGMEPIIEMRDKLLAAIKKAREECCDMSRKTARKEEE